MRLRTPDHIGIPSEAFHRAKLAGMHNTILLAPSSFAPKLAPLLDHLFCKAVLGDQDMGNKAKHSFSHTHSQLTRKERKISAQ
eukprot:scaffold46112_cov19-Tisochrysis_lutea.AAC.1